jgi:hypothetical protein
MRAKTDTIITAFLNEISPQPTAVPTQLAVSLAPIFQPTYAPAPSMISRMGSIMDYPPPDSVENELTPLTQNSCGTYADFIGI